MVGFKRKSLPCVLIVLMVSAVVLCLTAFSGCLLVPVVEGVSQVGVTRGDREVLLANKVKEANEAIYWGDRGRLMSLVQEESAEEIRRFVDNTPSDLRYVERKVVAMDLSGDGYKAAVRLKVKSYTPSTLVITERLEAQRWEFGFSKGWQMVSCSTEELRRR